MAVLYLDSYFDIPDFCFSKVITHSLLKKTNILAANTFQVRPIPTCMQIMLIFCTRYFSKISSSRFLKKFYEYCYIMILNVLLVNSQLYTDTPLIDQC